jgi:hypothetical protein
MKDLLNNTNVVVSIPPTFYDYFEQKNKDKDLVNQDECITSAKSIKKNINDLSKLPKTHKWLLEKIQKQLRHRGCLRDRTIDSICNEILNPENSSALLHYSKSPRKQGVESLQKEFIEKKWGIKILSGKENKLTPNGPHSYRLTKDGVLVKGVKMDRSIHHKSFDGKIIDDQILVFQKVTTDDGGSTDSVYEEVYETMMSCLNFLGKNTETKQKFVFILDGPYWDRKDSKEDSKNRFEKLVSYSSSGLMVVNSNTIKKSL